MKSEVSNHKKFKHSKNKDRIYVVKNSESMTAEELIDSIRDNIQQVLEAKAENIGNRSLPKENIKSHGKTK